HSAFQYVHRKLPNVHFEDATDVVGRARYVKSDEEIACLRNAVEIAEAGVQEMIAQAKPGLDAALLYARVMRRMLELGSEYYPLALHIGESERLTQPPAGLRLERGTLITNEVSAVWGTQVAQEDQPILLGRLPDAWKPVIELQREAFELGLQLLTPGAELGQLMDAVNGLGAKRGLRTSILMHGRGAGDDGPLLTPRATGEDLRDVRIEKNTAWVWKPTASTADGGISFTWGGDIVVGDEGAEALFKRPHGLVEV
ncbi:MAG: M24 family metallopeptidase, partial [Chloroflexota bacterium]